MDNPIFETIKNDVESNDVVLYMKGTASQPYCGFSATVVQILSLLGVQYKDINILEDRDLWAAVREFGNWPTFPQLYVKGELVGGCDITKEMYQTGELQALFDEKGISYVQAA